MSWRNALQGMSERKRRILELTHEYAMPNRVETLTGLGVPLVIGRREGYRIWDIDGHELMDLHLNGGTYNLGHRHPEMLACLREALETLDVGNHHFPAETHALLAEQLARLTPGELHYSVVTSTGSEANDIAIRSARYATGRRKIVSFEAAFHGGTALSGAASQVDSARFFHSDYADEFVKVPFDDLDAVDKALAGEDVAAVILETIPATFGFPIPSDDYLPGVKALCERYGSLYIADEVQTGLGRTGTLWAVEGWNVEPDILITGKGLSGGLYPVAAAVMSKRVGAWLEENGWAFVSTFGGSEIACALAQCALDICNREDVLASARRVARHLGVGLAELCQRHPFFIGVRQRGLVMGLEFDDPNGALRMSAALYRRGVWAMFAGYARSVLQWKPGLLVDEVYCDELLEKLDAALADVEAQR